MKIALYSCLFSLFLLEESFKRTNNTWIEQKAGDTRQYCTCNVIIGTWLLQWLHVASRYLQAFSTWSRRSFLKTLSLQSARTHGSSSNWQSFFKCTCKTNNSKFFIGKTIQSEIPDFSLYTIKILQKCFYLQLYDQFFTEKSDRCIKRHWISLYLVFTQTIVLLKN